MLLPAEGDASPYDGHDRVTGSEEYSIHAIDAPITQVDAVLREHEGSLRNIYNGFSDAGEEHGALTSKALMSFNEWMNLCECLQLIDTVFSRRNAVLCYVWSRMRVIDEARQASRIKMIHLSGVIALADAVRVSP